MILIRADANESIGSGHVMRCKSIASALADKGGEVAFITADHRGDSLIGEFPSFCLNSDWLNMDNELPKLYEIIRAKKPPLLLIDSYKVTEKYFDALHGLTKTAYIDDLNAGLWNVDILINYNIFSQSYDYSRYDRRNTRLLLGTSYTPLREEFRLSQPHVIREKISDVLISAGGSDPAMMTEKIIMNVCPEFPGVNFHFVIGALNPRIESIRKLSRQNIILHINERNMSGLMRDCDAAVSAAGSTLYELCACGTPSVTYVLADNQTDAAEMFGTLGVMINAGDCRKRDDISSVIIESLRGMNESVRAEMSARMQRLVDGNGAMRIADVIMRVIE